MPFQRGTTFFFKALDVHRGLGIPKAAPSGLTAPRLMAFFATELTQGPNVRFPNLHVTQAIKRLGSPGGRGAKTVPCEGVGGRLLPSATAASGRVCARHTMMVFVCHARRGRSRRGGGRTPMGSAFSNVLNACSRWEQPLGIFR